MLVDSMGSVVVDRADQLRKSESNILEQPHKWLSWTSRSGNP